MEQQLTSDERLYYQSLLEQTTLSPDSLKKMRTDNIENTAITTLLVGASGLVMGYMALGQIQEMEHYSREFFNLAAYGIPIAATALGAFFAWGKNELENKEQINFMKLEILYGVKGLLGNAPANEVNDLLCGLKPRSIHSS